MFTECAKFFIGLVDRYGMYFKIVFVIDETWENQPPALHGLNGKEKPRCIVTWFDSLRADAVAFFGQIAEKRTRPFLDS